MEDLEDGEKASTPLGKRETSEISPPFIMTFPPNNPSILAFVRVGMSGILS